jgi:hypothetical protein
MKKSEKVLLGIFAFLFLAIVGGGGLMYSFKNYMAIREENETLRDRLGEMNLAISQGADWSSKHEWLEEHCPNFTSRQEASAKMLDVITGQAEKIGLTIGGKEFIEAARVLGPDGLPLEENLGYFDKATVKITLAGVPEKAFYGWLHELQKPQSFLGITRMQINPSGSNKTINAEVEFTQFYREKSAPKVSKVN